MNKSKIVLAATGGILGLAILASAYFVWSAWSANDVALNGDDEGTEGLNAVRSKVCTLKNKSPYPCAESVKAISSNCEALVVWKEKAFQQVADGDRVFPSQTAPVFKDFIVDEAKRLLEWPGSADGRLLKKDFGFGHFRGYLTEGKMPSTNEVQVLQRQWDDICYVIDAMATNGVGEVISVEYKNKVAATVPDDGGKNAKNKKKTKNKQKKSAKNDKAANSQAANARIVNTYEFVFVASPAALVKVINVLAVSEQFIAIDSISFAPVADTLAEAVGGKDKKKDAAPTAATGRRGRRGRNAEAEAETKSAEAAKETLIEESPLKAQLTISISAFGATEAEGEEQK